MFRNVFSFAGSVSLCAYFRTTGAGNNGLTLGQDQYLQLARN